MSIHPDIPQTPTPPASPLPIVSIGAGGIVRDAHYPAYRLAGFDVAGVFDSDLEKARQLADDFGVPEVFTSIGDATASCGDAVLYDVAVPASALTDVLPELPDGAAVLMQKPMGDDLADARHILDICEHKRFTAAVNFQLRYAPFSIAAKSLIDDGAIGDLHSVAFRVTVHTPWHLWSFLKGIPRLEILYHSIHYVDLVRHFLGEPLGVYAKTTRHPASPGLAATRTTLILDYGDDIAASIVTDHGHDFGRKHQESEIRCDGTEGAIRAQMGVNLNYPEGEADVLEVTSAGEDWKTIDLRGTWFPHAFIGTAGSVMLAAAGEIDRAATDVRDAYRTMAVVEAAYESSESGRTPIPE